MNNKRKMKKKCVIKKIKEMFELLGKHSMLTVDFALPCKSWVKVEMRYENIC
jgi:NADH:ubiquinone oxidoreductase subunit B-like Fe-S oxidoreductase